MNRRIKIGGVGIAVIGFCWWLLTSEAPSPVEMAAEACEDGKAALLRFDFEGAFESFQEGARLDASSLGARLGLAEILIRRRRYTDAGETLRSALPLAHSTESWLDVGIAFRGARLPGEALSAFRLSLGKDSLACSSWLEIGALQIEGGRVAEAILAYQRAARSCPDSVRSGLARAFLLSGEPDSSAAHFHHALETSPGNPDLLAGLGEALFRGGEPAVSLPVLEDALRLDPYHIRARMLIGQVFVRVGKPKMADSHFEIFRRQKGLADQILELEISASQDPRSDTYRTLVHLYRLRGREDLARERLQRATLLDPLQTVPNDIGMEHY